MATITEDRQQQLNPGMALKVPCKVASTVALVLSGEQTIDGVACVDGDRVLVKDQANTVDNGIYVVSTGAWTRAQDFDGAYDATKGTLIIVNEGSSLGRFYRMTTNVSPIVFGTSAITFVLSTEAPVALESLIQVVDTIAALKALAAPTVAITYLVRGYYSNGDGGGGLFRWNSADATADNGGTVIQPNSAPAAGRWNRLYDGWKKAAWFGVAASQNAATNTTRMNAAIAASSVLELPAGTLPLNALDAITDRSIVIFGQGRETLLEFNTAGKGFTFGPFGTPTQNHNVRMSDIAFTNDTNTPSAYISQENYTNSVFERLYWEQDAAGTYAIDQVSGYGTKIRDCVWHFFTGTPIRLRDNGAVPNYSYVATVEHCDITSATGNGIEIEGGVVFRISHSVIEGVTGKGIVTSTNASGITGELIIDNVYFELNTGTDVDLGTNGGSYWGRATFMSCFFNSTATVALGSKSKATFIGIQGNGGSPLTVTGSANAEAHFIGCEMGNITQSGAFAWTVVRDSMPYVLAKSAVAASCPADATEDVLATITVPANAIGPNGIVVIDTVWTITNSANNKTLRVRFSGGAGTEYMTAVVTTNDSYKANTEIANRNATNSQVGSNPAAGGGFGGGGALVTSAVDTTAATTIVITGQKAVAGETLTLEKYCVTIKPGPV